MTSDATQRQRADLGDVQETLLWTLWQRSLEARRPRPVLADPQAVALVERIEYPFEQHFGTRGFGQWQALRVACFDREVRRFMAANPGGTVVALGEGLETQFWRVDDGRVRWCSVDLPDAIELRERLLPPDPRRRALACSALDERWVDELDRSRGLLVTAQGLLMYLAPADVHALLALCARRLPGAALVFDAVPSWLAAASRKGALRSSGGYQAPPWLWGLDAREERALAALPGVAELTALAPPRGRGPLHGVLLPLANRVPPLRRRMWSVLRARFSSAGAQPST